MQSLQFISSMIPSNHFWLLLALAVCSLSGVRSSNILVMSPGGTKSHANFYGEIVSVLLERGHQVTLLNSYLEKSHPNLTQITLDMRLDAIVNNTFVMADFSTILDITINFGPKMCFDNLQREDVKRINVEEFDLVMTGFYTTECFLTLIDGKNIPHILFFVNNIGLSLHDVAGNIGFNSFVPVMLSGLSHPMGFLGRLKNVLIFQALTFITDVFMPYWMIGECKSRGLCRQDLSSFSDIERKSSLLFLNNVRSLDEPARPYMPGVINVGGLNCRPAKPLPEDLESWVRESGENGFIYMSFGTVITPSDMTEESRRILVEVFKSLPYRVLWKWNEETMQDLPPNVKLAKWLPQQDILGHPKLKLFISHGGLFSTFEATYHGVPVLGIPIFMDQFRNVDRIVADGWAEKITWTELEEETLRKKITELMTDKRYSTEVQRRSSLMRDQLVSPREEVGYWTEYVIRHKGAPHLRSPVHDMCWYEVYNVDVWLLIGSACAGATALLLLISGAVIRCCCRRVGGKSAKLGKQKRH